MVILEHYIALFFANKQAVLYKKLEMSVSEVSQTLFCTDRNSKLTLKRLEDLGWIQWYPGRGRGNKSKIEFFKDPFALIFEKLKENVKNGQIKEARKMVRNYQTVYPYLSDRFNRWLDTLFGYHSETINQRKQEVLRLKIKHKAFNHLDPIRITLRSHSHLVKQICDTLIRFNSETGALEPHLAFYWEYNDIKKTWTFYLRKNVTFHNGKRMTAHDVLYTFSRFQTEKSNPFRWMLHSVKSLVVKDDYTFEIGLEDQHTLFLHLLCDEKLSVLPKPMETDTHHLDSSNLIGTGPFKIKQSDDEILVLEANESYFRERALLDRVEIWDTQDDEEWETDHYDHDLLFGYYPEALLKGKEKDGWKRSAFSVWNTQYLMFNLNKTGPQNQLAFREALRLILDPKQMINALQGERETVAYSFLPNNVNQQRPLKGEPRELIGKSGYQGEVLQLYTFNDQDHIEDVRWIQQRCREYGIAIEATFLPDDELIKKETIQTADIIHDSGSMNEQIEISFLHLLLTGPYFLNYHLDRHHLLKIEGEIQKLFSQEDEQKRLNLLSKIEKNLLLDTIQVLPLYRNQQSVHTQEHVQNIRLNREGWIDFYRIWFKQS